MELRLSKIENKQEETDKKVTELDKNSALFRQALDTFGDALDRFGAIAKSVEESMNKMDRRVLLVENSVKTDSEDITKLKCKFEDHADLQKIDIVKILKDNAITIVLVAYIILNHLGILKF